MKICSYGDIAAFAESLGHSYNEVIEMMSEDKFIPFYEAPYKEVYKGFGEEYCMSDDLTGIIDKFVEANGECAITE